MNGADGASWLLIPFQILVVDLLLGADNALVIALACRSLSPGDTRRAAAIGICGAIFARLAMTFTATWLLAIPLVRLIGAVALMTMALNMGESDGFDLPVTVNRRGAAPLWAAASVIIIADAALGIDNVVAIAAIARGNLWLLTIGVALSLPVLACGGILLAKALGQAPGLVMFGAATLGWLAGDMAISDPLIANGAAVNAPALVAIAPWLGAAFVYFTARGSRSEAARVPAEREASAEDRMMAFDHLIRADEEIPREAPREGASPRHSR